MLTVETDSARGRGTAAFGRVGVSGMCGGAGRVGPCSGPDGPRPGRGGSVVPRRSRCPGCRATHVLLPVMLLLRRADTATVIGAALVARAAGGGHRRIAERLGRPAATVRGWLRRFGGRVEAVRVVFTLRTRALAADPVLPGPAGSGWADAVAAVTAACGRVDGQVLRRGAGLAGRLRGLGGPVAGAGLARSDRPVLINTSCP